MTQKSAGRLARDARKKKVDALMKENADNKCWDELNQMYEDNLALLFAHTNIKTLAENKELIAMVEDKPTLTRNIVSLSNDLKTLNAELNDIHQKHKERSGGATDPDDLMFSIMLFENYYLWAERHNAVVMPTSYYIIEQFDAAEKKLRAFLKQQIDEANLKDPKVISDVEIVTETKKDETPTTTEEAAQ